MRQEQYTIENDQLVIKVPLKSTRFNPYDESENSPMDHVCGIIDGQDVGFGFWIDMSYADKGDQNTSIFYHWLGSTESFVKFCEDNKISIINYGTNEIEE